MVDYAKRKGIERTAAEKDLSTILAYSPDEWFNSALIFVYLNYIIYIIISLWLKMN